MKLQLPHRDVNLDSQLPFQERNSFIRKLLEEKIEFHNETMTVEEYFRYTWTKSTTKTCMDIIGYYLTKGNTEGEDREVMSHKKAEEMRKGSKRHTTFSSMDYNRQVEFGLIDTDDSYD